MANTLAKFGGNIIDAKQFDDLETGRFFMRVAFQFIGSDRLEELAPMFESLAGDYSMTYTLRPSSQKKRVLLMVSRFDHCLADLLYRWQIGELPMIPVGLVSNHSREQYRHLSLPDIPFHFLPVTKDTKAEQEARLKSIIEDAQADLVVLARYMRRLRAAAYRGTFLKPDVPKTAPFRADFACQLCVLICDGDVHCERFKPDPDNNGLQLVAA